METLAKLRWQCRRGTKELDALLQGYLTTEYMKAEDEEKSRFALLLKWEDDELQDVLLGEKEPVEAALKPLIDKIRRSSTCKCTIADCRKDKKELYITR